MKIPAQIYFKTLEEKKILSTSRKKKQIRKDEELQWL